ncbi:outer membrane beta-barrel protein [Chitinophaga sancti]|uniref:outer membrane beta-barrel protein n=1 Tax=Chitinophaga sancti TaxID=1004 RepID=UPI002A753B17|nr:outer membrane beta-barrel protein [Chitinophaga sancti]WPQ63368.1 outer membrane beta-barrel protein [Chitinophaga sancti]
MKSILSKYAIILMIVIFPFFLKGQNITIKGSLKDSTNLSIAGANILVISAFDSLHTVSDENGLFQFNKDNYAPFQLKISALGYSPLTRNFEPPTNVSTYIIPAILLTSSYHLLKEVVIKGKKSVAILRGDTIEYNINQFKLKGNAVLNDLLKRLPGLIVNADGSITFMGKSISQIRINGQDYPLKNVQALINVLSIEMLEKIQLIDDYGEIARITGRKDGEAKPIISIETQNTVKRNQQFKIKIGLGNKDRYLLSPVRTDITPSQQFFISGNSNNIGSGFDNTTNNANISLVKTKKKLSIRIITTWDKSKIKNEVEQFVQMETNSGKQYINSNSKNYLSTNAFAINTGFDYKFNKQSILGFNIRSGLNSNNSQNFFAASQSGLQTVMQQQNNYYEEKTPYLANSSYFVHKFNKTGRVFTIREYLNYQTVNSNTVNDNKLQFTYADGSSKDSILKQKIVPKTQNFILDIQSSWIEPINNYSDVEIKYNLNQLNNHYSQKTYYEYSNQKLELIDSLTNAYKNKTTQNEISASYKITSKKIELILGGKLLLYKINNKISAQKNYKTIGNIWFPLLRLQMQTGQSSMIVISTNSTVEYPNNQQSQLIPNRTNIQFPIFGNPNLKAESNNAINLEFRHTGINIVLLNIKTNLIKNQIVTNTVVYEDSSNNIINETHYLNLNGNYSFNLNGGISRSLKEGRYMLSWDFSSSLKHSNIYMNYIQKETNNLIFNSIIKSGFFPNWAELNASINYTYNRNRYLVTTNNIINFSTWNFQLNGKFFISKNWAIEFDYQKQINQGLNSSITANPITLNAAIERKIFKDKITCRLEGQNILNQVSNLTQTISSNSITQTRTNLIGSFYLFSVVLDLKKVRYSN